ncbi:hypothetical protein QBK93_17360 [Rhizobium leguminosarum]|nr:hypothetical protein [Rhizobium leguminosarum]MDI5926447.1 hypothetical protein [Rhizobium leguminosarum]
MAEKMSAAARKILKMRAKAIGYLAFFRSFHYLVYGRSYGRGWSCVIN